MEALRFEQMDSRKTIIGTAHARTCRWFLQSSAFQEWQNSYRLSDHHGFLWIRGKPGAGKSTLMKFLYQESKKTDRSGSSLTIASFFNARGHSLEKSVSGMYRSLILQLLSAYTDLQTVLDGVYFDSRKQNHVPSTEVLKDVLREGIWKLGRRSLRCFIDALDEGDEQQIIEMVRYFEDIAEEGIQKGIDFTLCFSSRHYPYIDVRHGVRLTLEDELGHADDLSTYIRSHLRINSLVPVANLEAQLLEKARGVFLWVVLVVAMLNKEARHGGFAILKRLREIPSGLSDLFQDILSRDKDHIPEFLLCMTWILFSKRSLNPSEFHHAMWSSLALTGLADEHLPNTTTPEFEQGARLSIISTSKGLAEVTKPPHTVVQFIHESVRDFLIKDNGLAELLPEFGESQGHNRLKEACMYYLKLQWEDEASRTNRRLSSVVYPTERQILRYPFLEYAVRHVLLHADDAAQYSPQDEFLSSFPTRRWVRTMYPSGMEAARSTFPRRDLRVGYGGLAFVQENSRLIYVLGYEGCANLIRTRLKQSVDYHGCGEEEYRYPVFAAVKSGSWRAVAAMLECSPFDIADVRVIKGPKGLLVGSEHKRYTPLTWAIMSRCIDIAVFLVRQGAENLWPDEDGNTPLCMAAEMGEARIVEALIQAGIDLDAPDGGGNRPLQSATRSGHVSIAKRLVQSGVDVNTTDSYGDRCIHLAAGDGDKTLCEMLFRAGAELNTPNGFGKTPLYLALEYGKEQVVSFLLENGVSVNTWDSNGDLPLCVASKNGHQHVVMRLVDLGAHIDAPNISGNLPLCLALDNGHGEIAQLMIHFGAVVNDTDAANRTPLYYASMHGHDTIVTCLIDSGVDVNARFADGHSPTSLALSQGHCHTARLLLTRGAVLDELAIELLTLLGSLMGPILITTLSQSPVVVEQMTARLWTGYLDESTRDSQGHGPLHLAIARGQLPTVQKLIQKGADVNARTWGGPRPLHVAVIYGRGNLAKVLIDAGADVNAGTFNGTRAIHLACFHGHVAMARLLIMNNADTMVRNVEGLTPLHMAASEEIVALLVSQGVDVNARSAGGSTPLHRAAKFGRLNVCTALLEEGRAFLNRRDSQKDTPMAVAWQSGPGSMAVGSSLLKLGGML
jgi:ankyrin repeat protein